MSGIELSNRVVLLLNLAVQTGRQNSRFRPALALRQLAAKVRNLGGDTTESLTNPLPDLLRLDKLITTDAVNVGTHGGQRVHDELVVVVAATATAIPASPVIISTPPSGTGGTTDSGTNKIAPPIVAVIATVQRIRNRKTFHNWKLLFIGY